MADLETLSRREWLATNGAGAFASGTVAGPAARRYHGLLIAALDPPAGRRMLLGAIDETIQIAGQKIDLATHVYEDGTVHPDGWRRVVRFAAEPVPTWTYALPGGATLVRRILLARGRNTAYVLWTRTGGGDARLTVAPLCADRDFHHQQRRIDTAPDLSEPDGAGWRLRLFPGGPTLRLFAHAAWKRAGWWNERLFQEIERRRGFDAIEDLYCPATAELNLADGVTVALAATIEEDDPPPWQISLRALTVHQESVTRDATDAVDRTLRLCADAFVVETPSRTSVLAGYPWFGDWGRDTFIALPGLLLTTGRFPLARRILLDFARFVRDGRIPNRFPDVGDEPAYNNVDATLWYVRAARLYAETADDPGFGAVFAPTLRAILDAHRAGTVGDGIGATPDGLLRGGGPGTNLTWMDAKIGGWVVTPRVGKPVEINALWIDALEFGAQLLGDETYRDASARALASFLAAFPRPDGLGLYDTIGDDGRPDRAIRPNQVVAAAALGRRLPQPLAVSVLETARRYLLTEVGLRTLAPIDPAYRGRYGGDGPARDSAYHQGTVWPWLLGAYVDLHRRVHGNEAGVAGLLAPLEARLDDFGLGGVAEIYDGDAPHRPDGCPWQAWSVAELLRVRSSPV